MPPQMAAPLAASVPKANDEARVENSRDGFWFNREAAQGSVIVGRVPKNAVSVSFNGEAIAVTPDGFFLLGFDRDAENSASLVAHFADGSRKEHYLAVKPGNWQIQHVSANPLGGAKTGSVAKIGGSQR